MDTTFLNWNRGSRLKSWAGIKLGEDNPPKYSSDYCALYIPLLGGLKLSDESFVAEANANARVQLIPDAEIKPTKVRLLIDVNPALYEYATVQCPNILDPGAEGLPIYASFFKKCNLEELDYLCRLYIIS